MNEPVSAFHVFVDNPASSIDEVQRFLAEQAVAASVATDVEEVCQAFRDREAMGTTGMMDGFAIPHAKSANIREACVFVVKLRQGIAWQSMDDKPVTCIISLLIPAAERGTTHLELLSRIAVLLMDDAVRAKLKATNDPSELAALLNASLAA